MVSKQVSASSKLDRLFVLFGSEDTIPKGDVHVVRIGYMFKPDETIRIRQEHGVSHIRVVSNRRQAATHRPRREQSVPARPYREWEISSGEFTSNWKQATHGKVVKHRRVFRFRGVSYVYDRFDGELSGLVLLQVHLRSRSGHRAYKLPRWARPAIEVTGNADYSTQELARVKWPVFQARHAELRDKALASPTDE